MLIHFINSVKFVINFGILFSMPSVENFKFFFLRAGKQLFLTHKIIYHKYYFQFSLVVLRTTVVLKLIDDAL